MSSLRILVLEVLGLPVLLGAASLSQAKTLRTQRPSVSFVTDIDDYGSGMGFADLKRDFPQDVVYDHMPKAGGTFLIHLLKSAIGQEHFSFESEFKNLTKDDVQHKFVIGSVRNPFEYYLSLWAYGAEHGGRMIHAVPKERRWVYETQSEFKDSPADIHRFRRWVRMVNRAGYPGVMSVRFAQSYAVLDTVIHAATPPMNLEPRELDAVARALSRPTFMKRVDCWIKADDMRNSSKVCLNEWAQNTGLQVNWTAYEEAFKDGNQLASSHKGCKAYFTPALEKYVRSLEAPIFKYFGYGKCSA